MTPHEDEPRLVLEAISASAERAVSCRRLQSKQPTSTTTNLPSPGRDRRRGMLGSRRAGRRPPDGVGAPSPHRLPDSRCRLARIDEGLAARAHPCARRQPGFHERGGRPTSGATTSLKHRALCWHTHDRRTLTLARSARAPPVAVQPRYRLEADIADRSPAEADARSEPPASRSARCT